MIHLPSDLPSRNINGTSRRSHFVLESEKNMRPSFDRSRSLKKTGTALSTSVFGEKTSVVLPGKTNKQYYLFARE